MKDDTVVGYCGEGRFATNNENAKNKAVSLQPIKWSELRDMVDDPTEVDKLKAWWVIFNDSKSRLIVDVTEDTRYFALWADIDKADIETEKIRQVIGLWTGGCDCEVYSSQSASKGNRKARAIIPLESACDVETWVSLQILLQEELNRNGIECDPVSKNPVQIMFLPNRGEYYSNSSSRNDIYFDPINDGFFDDIEIIKSRMESGGDKSNNREYNFGGSGFTHKEIIKILCSGGEGYHVCQNAYAWGRIREGATRGAVIGELETFAEMWKEESESESGRWNDRFKDIGRCVDGAIERCGKDKEKVDIDDIDLDKPRIKRMKLPMPPGMLGKLCDNALDMSWHPHNEVALASALGLIAGIAGRKFNVSNTGLNLYVTLVADTAMGKDSINRFVNGTLASLNIVGHSSSFIGLSDCTGPKPMARSVQIARSKICVFEEAGLMMASQSGAQLELQKFLLSSYTSSGWNGLCGGKGYSDEKNDIPLIHAMSLSIISESTPDIMYRALKATGALNSGHIPRQTILRVTGDKPLRNKEPKKKIDKELYDRLLRLCNKCCEIQAKDRLKEDDVFHFEWPDDLLAEEYAFSSMCVGIENKFKDTPRGRMAGRAAVKAMKYTAIAMVLNYDHELVVQRREWEWGKALALYELNSVDEFFDGSVFADETDSLVKGLLAPSIIRLLRGEGLDDQAKLTSHEIRKGYLPQTKITRDNKQKAKLRFDERFTHTECIKKLLKDMVDVGYLDINYSALDHCSKAYKCPVYTITDGFRSLFDL